MTRHSVRNLYALTVTDVAFGTQAVVTDPCPVCGHEAAMPKFLIEGPGFQIVDCIKCRLGSLWPRPTAAEIQSFYPENYYGDGGSKFSSIIEPLVRMIAARSAWFIARSIRQKGRVLDVGCGRGMTLRALADAGCETHCAAACFRSRSIH